MSLSALPIDLDTTETGKCLIGLKQLLADMRLVTNKLVWSHTVYVWLNVLHKGLLCLCSSQENMIG